jgi:hypothetical protein
MVFNVFEDRESLPDKLHPEQQIVQYVLPCFVASFLEFANNDVELKNKENYVKIVHELIKNFEVDPIKVAYMEGPFSGGFSPYLLVNSFLYYVMYWQAQLIADGLKTALGSSPEAKNIAKTLDRKFISALLDSDNSWLDLDPSGFSKLHIIWGMWRIQVYRLLSRITSAIETAVPGCLPNLKVLEMVMIANISFRDYYVDVWSTPTTVSLYPL